MTYAKAKFVRIDLANEFLAINGSGSSESYEFSGIEPGENLPPPSPSRAGSRSTRSPHRGKRVE